jgi:hypothetical protein
MFSKSDLDTYPGLTRIPASAKSCTIEAVCVRGACSLPALLVPRRPPCSSEVPKPYDPKANQSVSEDQSAPVMN